MAQRKRERKLRVRVAGILPDYISGHVRTCTGRDVEWVRAKFVMKENKQAHFRNYLIENS